MRRADCYREASRGVSGRRLVAALVASAVALVVSPTALRAETFELDGLVLRLRDDWTPIDATRDGTTTDDAMAWRLATDDAVAHLRVIPYEAPVLVAQAAREDVAESLRRALGATGELDGVEILSTQVSEIGGAPGYRVRMRFTVDGRQIEQLAVLVAAARSWLIVFSTDADRAQDLSPSVEAVLEDLVVARPAALAAAWPVLAFAFSAGLWRWRRDRRSVDSR